MTDPRTRKDNFGKARRRWEDNIRMDLEEVGVNTRIRLRKWIVGKP